MSETRITLTWAQFVWVIGLLVAILLTWGDLRVAMARLELRVTAIERQVMK